MKRQADYVKPQATKAGNAVRARQAITREAISLAKAQINDGGMDDANAIDAACEQYPGAVRAVVVKAIADWK
jgi:hypothetical protein